MKRYDALRAAEDANLDLLCVAPMAKPPVCKILNYGKYRFEKQKKAKEIKKNQKVVEVKEARLTPQIDLHDLETKVKAANKWLEEGNKVKVTVRFRGRQMAHVDLGIMTTNIGTSEKYGSLPLGFSSDSLNVEDTRRKKMIDELKRYFSPEFLNRIDDIIIFNSLSHDSLYKICDNMLISLCAKIKDVGVDMRFDSGVIDFILSQNKSNSYGAREISRIIKKHFEDAYIEEYFSGKINIGDSVFAFVEDEVYRSVNYLY